MIEINEWADRITALVEGQLRLWTGLAASVTGALLLSSDVITDGPTKHILSIICIASTAACGYLLRRRKEQ